MLAKRKVIVSSNRGLLKKSMIDKVDRTFSREIIKTINKEQGQAHGLCTVADERAAKGKLHDSV
jgi:hypothetical protein